MAKTKTQTSRRVDHSTTETANNDESPRATLHQALHEALDRAIQSAGSFADPLGTAEFALAIFSRYCEGSLDFEAVGRSLEDWRGQHDGAIRTARAVAKLYPELIEAADGGYGAI